MRKFKCPNRVINGFYRVISDFIQAILNTVILSFLKRERVPGRSALQPFSLATSDCKIRSTLQKLKLLKRNLIDNVNTEKFQIFLFQRQKRIF